MLKKYSVSDGSKTTLIKSNDMHVEEKIHMGWFSKGSKGVMKASKGVPYSVVLS